jgi:hypothetical protein
MRPFPLLPHNGQQFLVDSPLSGAGVGGERKREGVAMTGDRFWVCLYIILGHCLALELALKGWLGFMMFRGLRLMLLCRLNQKQKEATTPLHQLSRDVDGGEEGDKPSIVDLLLFHPCAQPITGAEAWELELGETVQRVGAMSAGAGVGGSGVVRMGRGRKVSAKVGGVSEGGQSIEEKDNDEEKGKGKAEGNGRERESQSGKHKRRRRETKREGKGRRRGREETELMQRIQT